MSLLVTFTSGIIGALVAPRRRSSVLRGTGAILACVSVLAGSVRVRRVGGVRAHGGHSRP